MFSHCGIQIALRVRNNVCYLGELIPNSCFCFYLSTVVCKLESHVQSSVYSVLIEHESTVLTEDFHLQQLTGTLNAILAFLRPSI